MCTIIIYNVRIGRFYCLPKIAWVDFFPLASQTAGAENDPAMCPTFTVRWLPVNHEYRPVGTGDGAVPTTVVS